MDGIISAVVPGLSADFPDTTATSNPAWDKPSSSHSSRSASGDDDVHGHIVRQKQALFHHAKVNAGPGIAIGRKARPLERQQETLFCWPVMLCLPVGSWHRAASVNWRRTFGTPEEKEGDMAAAKAFSVHLLTASGSFLAFLSVVAASEQRWTSMFLWLGLALFVDGIDGPIARKLQVKEVLPNWSGDTLDNIIDYITYVLIPAFALYQRGFMGENLSFISAAIIVVSSAIYYADTGMKTKENFFKGFPVVWNMVVFTLFIVEPGEIAAFAVVVVTAILSFVPINFLHPVGWCVCAT